jgi:predicted nucleic acid-binding protein
MNVLIDTNVVLDVLLDRRPFVALSSKILVLSEKNLITGFISASSATDIFYIAQKTFQSTDKTYDALKSLFKTVKIASVDGKLIHEALALKWSDFEDCVQFVAARDAEADYIVTRNPDDFTGSSVLPISPAAFLAQHTCPTNDG